MIPEEPLSKKGMRYVNYGNFFLGASFLFLVDQITPSFTKNVGIISAVALLYCYMKAWNEVDLDYY